MDGNGRVDLCCGQSPTIRNQHRSQCSEVTIGEQLKTPGSLHNLSGIALIGILLSVLQPLRKRNQTQDDPWGDSNLEHLVQVMASLTTTESSNQGIDTIKH